MKYLKRFNESEELGKWWHPHFDSNNNEDDFEDTDSNVNWDNEDEGQDEADIEDCYAMAYDKIDKMLPADSELQKEFYEIIDSEEEITTKYTEMEEFFVINIDEDRFDSYCRNGNLKDFATYVVQKELDIEEE
jgi:hypothetical protein